MAEVSPLILVVEDNSDDEMLTVRTVSKELPNARVLVARDGEEALGYLDGQLTVDGQKVAGVPDFVILDLKLPKMSGDVVLKEIRDCESTACVPVVVFSSSDTVSDVQACYLAGANSYVCKPVDYKDYVESVRSVARYWFTISRLPGPCVEPVATT